MPSNSLSWGNLKNEIATIERAAKLQIVKKSLMKKQTTSTLCHKPVRFSHGTTVLLTCSSFDSFQKIVNNLFFQKKKLPQTQQNKPVLLVHGKSEAKKAGKLIKQEKIEVNLYYSSFQLRAKNTLKIIQEELQDFKEVKSTWELNERHYGALTGLNKDEMKKKLGEEKVHQFRRSWDLRPDPLDKKNPYHPLNIETYKEIPLEKIPDTESLKDTYERVIKL